MTDAKERIKIALSINWQEVVPFEKRGDFLEIEKAYTTNISKRWKTITDESENNDEIEETRALYLEQRAEILKYYALHILKMSEHQFESYRK